MPIMHQLDAILFDHLPSPDSEDTAVESQHYVTNVTVSIFKRFMQVVCATFNISGIWWVVDIFCFFTIQSCQQNDTQVRMV